MSLLSRFRRTDTTDIASRDAAWSRVHDPLPVTSSRSTKSVAKVVGRTLVVIGSIIGTLTVVSALNVITLGGVNHLFGLVPRTASGALGILLHPFLHASIEHLATNAVGLTLLGGLVMLREERDFWIVTALGVVVGGAGTWLVGREALHIGASGVVFAYLGYLLTTGWFDRRISSIALSLGVAVAWGSLLFGLSPLQNGISWELHLFGFIGGVLGARLRRNRRNRIS